MDIRTRLTGIDPDEISSLRFVFDLPIGMVTALLFLFLVGLICFFLAWSSLKTLPRPAALGLSLLRTAVVLLATFLLLRPTLVGFRYDPARSFLLLLYDNSASMSIGNQGQRRGQRLQQALEANREAFKERLEKRYQLAHYAYGHHSLRIENEQSLGFDRPESNHVAAIESALRDFRGIDVAGVILFSDGIDQPGGSPMLENCPVPVIAVGIGDNESWQDLSLDQVNFSRGHGDERPVKLSAQLAATGLSGRRAVVEVVQKETVVASQTLEIGSDFQELQVRLEFQPKGEGWLDYRAQVRLEALAAFGSDLVSQDRVPENNEQHFLVDNRSHKWKVLYFNGRPNWENKYVQRALAEDGELELTSVIRISKAQTSFVYRGRKSSLVNPLFEGFYNNGEDPPRYDESVFLRFGGRQEDAGKGFPEDSRELFEYDLVVIGDVEAEFFSSGQGEMIREYVRKRGGNLLMLGGPHSFSEGGYQGTVFEGMLPVLLEKRPKRELELDPGPGFKVNPTTEGLLAGSWALDVNPERNRTLWQDLPELYGLNLFPMTRAGAVILANASTNGPENEPSPLFVLQRYGEGRTAVLATGSTWLWHMGTKEKDNRHARFWRQLVHSLIAETPGQIRMRNKLDQYPVQAEAGLEVVVHDALFNQMPGMQTRWLLSQPGGGESRLSVDESLRESGLYTSSFKPDQPGVYQLEIQVNDQAGLPVGNLSEAVLVEADTREFRRTRSDPAFLTQLASKNGGSYFPLEQLDRIPDQIPWKKEQKAEVVSFPLWHLPVFFLLMAALLVPEWYLRRIRGYA